MRQGEPENVTEQAVNTPCHMQPQRMCNTRNRLNSVYGFTHVVSLLSNGMAPKQIKIHRFQCCCCYSFSSSSFSSLSIKLVNIQCILFVAENKYTNQYQSIAIDTFLISWSNWNYFCSPSNWQYFSCAKLVGNPNIMHLVQIDWFH